MTNHPLSIHPYSVQPGDSVWQLAQRFGISLHDIFALNPGMDPNCLYVGQRIAIPLKTEARSTKCITSQEVELKSDMRGLWEQHIAWTRMTIISLTFKLPDVDPVVTRLLQNATDMGDVLKPWYGNELGDMYASLIREHLTLAAELVKAALAGNQQAAAEAERKWYANADKISVFLGKINPFLTVEEVRKMFYKHLDLTKTEAVLMINMDYQKDIQVYDEIQKQAIGMSDAITDAIVKQFQTKFR
ncbi:LysM domain-containing protein [Bacillus sp. REN3]|uniref:LysM peptidoglycan-binding domain-containing protein n=1 Tax=Bacillus sp. REN3 TaxID=2802440 RepID=UPI001AEEAF18|nr:LysM domain-containing protein [Bacillus sp. REN3]